MMANGMVDAGNPEDDEREEWIGEGE